MTKVLLKGRIGKIVGKEFNFQCRTLREVFDAINANTKDRLRDYLSLSRKRIFSVFIDNKPVDINQQLNTRVDNAEIVIVPILFGGVFFTGAGLGALFTGGAFGGGVAGFLTTTVVFSALSFGVSFLISKLFGPKDPESTNTSSFIFGGAENVAAQGVVVPVGYGRLVIGSRVVSADIFSVEKRVFDEMDFTRFNNPVSAPEAKMTSDGLIQKI